jgi:hypothetical protein
MQQEKVLCLNWGDKSPLTNTMSLQIKFIQYFLKDQIYTIFDKMVQTIFFCKVFQKL